MKKTEASDIKLNNRIAVDINGLRAILSVGRCTAERVGEASGAVVKLGKRKLYNVAKVRNYINEISGQKEEKAPNDDQYIIRGIYRGVKDGR